MASSAFNLLNVNPLVVFLFLPFSSIFNRRRFLKSIPMVGLLTSSRSLFAAATYALSKTPESGSASLSRIVPSTFTPLPLGKVLPKGWLHSQLTLQAKSLSGHLDETWPDVGSNSGWLGGTGESWERGPYYLDGLVPLAYLLDDERLKQKAQRFVEWALASQTKSGMFGPASNDDWWPRMVMLKALTQYQEATGDHRILPMMQRYFVHMRTELPQRPLKSWGRFRWQDQLLTVLWLYDRTADPSLIELMHLLQRQGYNWVAQYADFRYKDQMSEARLTLLAAMTGFSEVRMETHGVNNGEAIKTGAVWSRVSGAQSDRQAVARMIAELDRYHGLPNGMFSCDEHLAGRNPSQGSELCTVVEYMYSLEQSLAVLGDPAFGDRLEKLAFNALPGTMTDDMWAHQYDQQPNQVECSLHREPWTTNGPESNLYGLEPHFGCCTANFSQGWPKFAAHLFMTSSDGGIVATAYSPCEVKVQLQGTVLEIQEETQYPFREEILLALNPSRPVTFPLSLRIPAWAVDAELSVNGRREPAPQAGTFARILREWKRGDKVILKLPMKPRIIEGFNGSVSVERGPLVFSCQIGQDWLKLRDRGLTADWQVYPKTQWNYALVASRNAGPPDISITEHPLTEVPFASSHPPVQLHANARLVPSWQATEGVAASPPESPVQTTEPEQMLTLVPYASAKLRITSFPRADHAR